MASIRPSTRSYRATRSRGSCSRTVSDGSSGTERGVGRAISVREARNRRPALRASSLWGTRIERIERILRIARLRGREHRAPHGRRMNDKNVFVVNKKSKGLANERLDAPSAAERSVKSVQSVQSVFHRAR